MRPKRFLSAFASLALATGLLAVPAPAAAATGAVGMTSSGCGTNPYCFQPHTELIPTGGSVLWANSSGAPHTATSDSGVFDTGTVNSGTSSGPVMFSVAGQYPYHCSFHPYMHGTVLVGLTPRVALPTMANAAYGGYTTVAYIENTGSAAALVHIDYFDVTGNAVGAGDDALSLAAHAMWTVRQDNGNSFAAGAAGSAIVYSDQPVAAFVNEFAPGSADASSYAGIRIGSGNGITLYAPAIANNAYGGYTTGLGILNTGQTTDIQITYRDANGMIAQAQTLPAVPPHAYRDAYSGSAGLPDHFAGTATITAVNPMPGLSSLAAVVNEVGPHGQFSSYDAVANATNVVYAPTMLNGGFGGYYTGIGVRNTTATAGNVSVTYHDIAGTAVKSVTSLPIAANGYLAIYQGDTALGPPPSANGYSATLTADVAIAAVVNEVAPPPAASGGGQQFTSYNVSPAGSVTVNAPLVENAGSDGWSTGLGIMNTGGLSANLTISYFDAATGALLAAKMVTLAPQAFLGEYTPDDLAAGKRATATVSSNSIMAAVAVIVNESNASSFMSYGGQ